jgi:hypothetical protein
MSTEAKTFGVVKVLDRYQVVINGGSSNGITEKDRFVIYELGEELIDPESKELLGRLEIVKGSGRPIHIQEKLTTIKSNEVRSQSARRTIVKRSGGGDIFTALAREPITEETIEPRDDVLEPFADPKVGDRAKKLN